MYDQIEAADRSSHAQEITIVNIIVTKSPPHQVSPRSRVVAVDGIVVPLD